VSEARTQFGISLVPATDQLDRIRRLVQVADETGLDVVGIQDHPPPRRSTC
jgi:alkanesulfonate monooxygenase SsuD/methylene tetrahydromethanopterin reductase-like flavin-dependent oxidoreductase (luciferase family)